MMGAWFPLRVYGDHWNVYYLPDPPGNSSLIILFATWLIFIVAMGILYVINQGMGDPTVKGLSIIWGAIVALAGIVAFSGTEGANASWIPWIGRAMTPSIGYTGVSLLFLSSAFALGFLVVKASEEPSSTTRPPPVHPAGDDRRDEPPRSPPMGV
jgi:hypothetical protein